MSQGVVAAQLNRATDILKSLGLLRDRNYYPGYSSVKASEFRQLSYLEVWKKSYTERLYDFQLSDGSLLQFRSGVGKKTDHSYAYLDSPYQYRPTFDEFLSQFDEEDIFRIQRDYDLLDSDVKQDVTPIRYDYAPDQYTIGRHPASHIHFGHGNQIRVATRNVLTPLAFLLLVIRQCYPNQWVHLLMDKETNNLCRNVREVLVAVPDTHWGNYDDWELFLS